MSKLMGLIGVAITKSGFVSVLAGVTILAVANGYDGLSLFLAAVMVQVGVIVTAAGVVVAIAGLFLMTGAEAWQAKERIEDEGVETK